jgi:hypothetical protein
VSANKGDEAAAGPCEQYIFRDFFFGAACVQICPCGGDTELPDFISDNVY